MWYKTLIKSVLAQKEGFLLLAVVCKSMCTMSRIIKESTESYISVLRFQRDIPYKFIRVKTMWSKNKCLFKEHLHVTLVFVQVRPIWDKGVVPSWQSRLNGSHTTTGLITLG